LALITSGIQLYSNYRRDLSTIDLVFAQIEQTHLDSLANSLWQMNETQIRLQLNGMLRLPDVEFVVVNGNAGEYFEAGQKSTGPGITRHYALRDKTSREATLGTLSVHVGLAGVYSRLIDAGLVILVTNAVKTFVISLFILFITFRWVTRHLGQMARYARSLSIERLGEPIVLSRGPRHIADELDEVATALSAMSQALKERTDELRVAKEEVEVADRAKSAFLANMSHELRTPLNAVLGYAQILKREKTLSTRQLAGLNTIQRSGEHLLMLVNDILDLSKIEAGKLELYPGPINLPAFLRVIADIIRLKAEEKSLSFKYLESPGLPMAVLADEKRLRQVLLNLLDNAVKFTDRGQVSFEVQSLRGSDSHAILQFEVIDTGIGISETQLGTLFRPFEQVGAVDRRLAGTGLGLAISRQLVRMMGGDILVDSKVGEGSRFRFELSTPSIADLPTVPLERNITGYQGTRRKVLIVDDVLGNRLMLVDLLAPLGFDIHEAVNGEDGVEQAQTVWPDLILMDRMMPVMDGLEAIRRIRKIPNLQQVPIFVISASTRQEDRTESLAAGATYFIGKPIQEAHLLSEIGQHLALTWTYDEQTSDESVAGSENATQLVAPPPEEMQVLYELALIGNMRAIREWATHAATLNEQYLPFTDKLFQLAENFQSQSILKLVEKYMRRDRGQSPGE
jgi:signal transduction histidine kinase/DNA-binding response OmpR family regulator